MNEGTDGTGLGRCAVRVLRVALPAVAVAWVVRGDVATVFADHAASAAHVEWAVTGAELTLAGHMEGK